MKSMKCTECGAPMRVRRETVTDHRIGLSGLVLENFPVAYCTKCDNRGLIFPHLDDLLKTLAEQLIRKKSRLTGEEIRFLRKYLGWSSSDLAAQLGVNLSTVSRWEHDKEPIGVVPERLLRMFVVHRAHVENYNLETMQEIDAKEARVRRIRARPLRNRWQLQPA